MVYVWVNPRNKDNRHMMEFATDWEQACQKQKERQMRQNHSFGGYIEREVKWIQRLQAFAEERSSSDQLRAKKYEEDAKNGLMLLQERIEHDKQIEKCNRIDHICPAHTYLKSQCRICGTSFYYCSTQPSKPSTCIDCLLSKAWNTNE